MISFSLTRLTHPMYLISQEPDLDKGVLTPKVPTDITYRTERETPRIRFYKNLPGALRAQNQDISGRLFYVYSPIGRDLRMHYPEKRDVPEIDLTNEVWVSEAIKVKRSDFFV